MMGNNSGSPKKSRVPFFIGIIMIVCVIALMVIQDKSESSSPLMLLCGIAIVIGGFAAMIIYSSVTAAKRRKLMGETKEKTTASDIVMYISAGVGGVGLLGLLYSLCFMETVNYLAVLGELAVFIAGFSVTYNVFMKKKKHTLSDEENESESEPK